MVRQHSIHKHPLLSEHQKQMTLNSNLSFKQRKWQNHIHRRTGKYFIRQKLHGNNYQFDICYYQIHTINVTDYSSHLAGCNITNNSCISPIVSNVKTNNLLFAMTTIKMFHSLDSTKKCFIFFLIIFMFCFSEDVISVISSLYSIMRDRKWSKIQNI